MAAALVLAGCGGVARSVEAACSTLDGLTIADVDLQAGDDVAAIATQLDELEAVIPEDYVGDVRAVRDGLVRVLELAARHPEAASLSALPEEARREANDTLVAITWPAQRLEAFRTTSCP